ncbi:MAG: LemA family protein [Bacilli bacterium]|nr:LemA family protein [Bacilli bacterium]
MSVFITCLSLIILVCLILIWVASTYNRFQIFTIRINEAETNIDSVLRKRFDLLNKSIEIIKENTDTDDNVLGLIEKLKSKKLSNFELDRKLYDAMKEFNKYKERFPKLKNNDAFVKIDVAITESEAEIVAFRKYYNDIITDYNKAVKSFPTNLVGLIFNFKSKLYFDGKDMNDDDIKDFKL